MAPRLQEQYLNVIRPALSKELGIANPMAIPRLTKIVVNMGVGEAVQDKKHLEIAVDAMADITGQRPVITLARHSIAGFKLREGMAIGCKVTLRKHRMYEFLDRLITITLPRVRDFRGLNVKSFDGTGNYSLGIQEQIVFPEIDFDKIDAIRGLDICITTSAKTNEEAKALLEAFNLPLKDRDKKQEG